MFPTQNYTVITSSFRLTLSIVPVITPTVTQNNQQVQHKVLKPPHLYLKQNHHEIPHLLLNSSKITPITEQLYIQ